jgi:hypothetical protein
MALRRDGFTVGEEIRQIEVEDPEDLEEVVERNPILTASGGCR